MLKVEGTLEIILYTWNQVPEKSSNQQRIWDTTQDIFIASFSTLSSQYHTSPLDIIGKWGLADIIMKEFFRRSKTLLKEH